jgi:heptosyltransferase-2
MKLPLIHFDCKYFVGDRPCSPNKLYGVFCENCGYYEKEQDVLFSSIKPAIELHPDNSKVKIAIIKLEAVGDVLRTTAILPSLKKHYPHSLITWITRTKSNPVLKDNQYINEVYTVETHLNEFSQKEYDIAINLDSSRESCEIMNKTNARKKFGYELVNNKPFPVNDNASEWYLMGVNDNLKKANKKTYFRIIHEICGLEYSGSSPVLNITGEIKSRAVRINSKFELNRFKDFILINLGGGTRWQYKKWTKEGYSELVNTLAALEPEKAIGVIAGVEDIEIYNETLSLISFKNNVILFGFNNPVEDFISIIYLAGKIFTSDSLAFHIATALGKYAVVIVGPTSHSELDVFGKGKIIFSNKVDCLVCYLNKCDKVVTCMNTVPAEEIIPLMR